MAVPITLLAAILAGTAALDVDDFVNPSLRGKEPNDTLPRDPRRNDTAVLFRLK